MCKLWVMVLFLLVLSVGACELQECEDLVRQFQAKETRLYADSATEMNGTQNVSTNVSELNVSALPEDVITEYTQPAELAELAKAIGECYKNHAERSAAHNYYKLSGEYYSIAAYKLVKTGDHNQRVIWYVSSGDAYMQADMREEADNAYTKALDAWEAHETEMRFSKGMIESRLYEMENPMPLSLGDVESDERIEYLPWLFVALAVFFVGMIMVFIRR